MIESSHLLSPSSVELTQRSARTARNSIRSNKVWGQWLEKINSPVRPQQFLLHWIESVHHFRTNKPRRKLDKCRLLIQLIIITLQIHHVRMSECQRGKQTKNAAKCTQKNNNRLNQNQNSHAHTHTKFHRKMKEEAQQESIQFQLGLLFRSIHKADKRS